MKKQITLIVFALFGSFALTVKSEAKVFIDPEKTAVDGSLEVKLTLRSKASNEPECRVVIDLGDGNLKRLRVGPGVGNQPLKVVDHQYEKAGTYEIRLRAPRQGADSKSSIPPCDVATKPLKLLVEAPKDKSEPQRPNNRKNPDEVVGGREKTVTENTRADKSENLQKELAAREESIKRREAELAQREQALKAELQKNLSDMDKKRQELVEREAKLADARPSQQASKTVETPKPVASEQKAPTKELPREQSKDVLGSNKIFIADPKEAPIFRRQTAGDPHVTRFWPCKGYVNEEVINVSRKNLVIWAELRRMKPPGNGACFFGIMTFRDNPFSYFMQFTNPGEESPLEIEDYFYLVSFRILKGELNQEYHISSQSMKKAVFGCSKGDIFKACPVD